MKKNLDITKPHYSEHILPVLGHLLYRGSTVHPGIVVMLSTSFVIAGNKLQRKAM